MTRHYFRDRLKDAGKGLENSEQYEAAKKDSEYFMRLIELAVEYHKEG